MQFRGWEGKETQNEIHTRQGNLDKPVFVTSGLYSGFQLLWTLPRQEAPPRLGAENCSYPPGQSPPYGSDRLLPGWEEGF